MMRKRDEVRLVSIRCFHCREMGALNVVQDCRGGHEKQHIIVCDKCVRKHQVNRNAPVSRLKTCAYWHR